ncbi:MAG: PaaI family thioesterase [Pseudomonadota bacterium]
MDYRDDLDWIDYSPRGFNVHAGPFRIARLDEARFYMALEIEARHLNQGGVVHGGVSMTLADNAMGMAAFYVGGERPASTIEFSCKLIAAAKHGSPLYGEAEVVRQTKDVAFVNAELWSGGRRTFLASGVWKYINPKGWGERAVN